MEIFMSTSIRERNVSGNILSIFDVIRSGPGVLSSKLFIASRKIGSVRNGSFFHIFCGYNSF